MEALQMLIRLGVSHGKADNDPNEGRERSERPSRFEWLGLNYRTSMTVSAAFCILGRVNSISDLSRHIN